jgi:hypothetical protein
MEEKKIVTAVAVKERAERPEIVVVSDRLSRANQLDTSIKLRAQVINENLFEMCRELKEMRDDKLYQELGYQNFEEYCEKAVGITRQYAYDHISVYENLPEDFVNSSLQNGGSKKKLMLIAKASEPVRTQVIEENPELKLTVNQLQARIKKLEEIRARQETEIKETMEEIEQKDTMFADLRHRFDILMDEKDELFEENIQLGEELEDARAQAGQNAVIEATYTDNADRINELESRLREQEKSHQQEVRTLKEDYETKIEKAKSTAVRVPDYTETYLLLVQNAKEAIGKLKSFMKQQSELTGSGYDYYHMVFLTLANTEVQIIDKNKKGD